MEQIKAELAGQVATLLEGVAAEGIATMMEYPPNEEMGDISLPCFKLSRQLRKSPQAISSELKDSLMAKSAELNGLIGRIEAESGYLNFYVDKGGLANWTIRSILQAGERYGAQTIGTGQTVVIDYSSPNIAKPFHIGHLRSTVIGNALYRIYSFLGYQVIGINHLGDWGTQFGKLIVAFQHWGEVAKLEEAPIDELLRLYIKFHAEADGYPELEEEARAWFVRMEQGDEEALRLWRWFVEISMDEFQKIYDLLGVHFDHVTGESFYNDRTTPVIQELKDKGLLEVDEGARLVRLDAYGMAPALMLKKDGSTLYHTRDVAAALYRKEAYRFDKAIYVTDYSQSLHFQQWFKVVELMGYDWSKDLVHVPFGRVSLEGASLSTRKGNVVKLDDLLQQAIFKAREIIESKNPGLDQKDEVARQVGIGAVIFNDLTGNRIKDISFSWKDALSFEGETGPYVQYTHVRACSLLRKVDEQREGIQAILGSEAKAYFDCLTQKAEFEVIKQLSLFPETIRQAAEKMEPSLLSRGLIDLAQAFNRFYRECSVLVDDAAVRSARLALVWCVQVTLQSGLHLVGLEAPERM
ncbi:arginine--tRNA ligase [Paenibacillus puldeungensis]|uniref:Arginine--tRNA ligase n=1 Tax=Paenibacillus puldeungensis TaxID=696536 RepID=A0ABW3S4V1_9BACL